MSKKQLDAFVEKIRTDTSLQEKLKGADPEKAIELARAHGFEVTKDDFDTAGTQASNRISEKDLEELVAGTGCVPWLPTDY